MTLRRASLRPVLICCALTLLAAHPALGQEQRTEDPPSAASLPTDGARGDTSNGPAAPEEYALSVRLAMEAFTKGDYELARSQFDVALRFAPQGPDRDTLAFNAAVCSYQLAQYDEAERRFIQIAQSGSALGPSATLNAGLAAIARGDVTRASALLDESDAVDDETRQLRSRLKSEIAGAKQAASLQAFKQHFERGARAIEQRNWPLAQSELQAARASGQATDRELATIHYLASVAAFEMNQLDEAEREADLGLNHDSGDAYLNLHRGDIALAQRDLSAAEGRYDTALRLGLPPRERERVIRDIDSLYPLPTSGFSGWAISGGGYDSNATQSGTANAIATSGSNTQQGSPFASVAARLELPFRVDRHVALGPFYDLDWLALWDASVRDLSLQTHEGGFKMALAPTHDSQVDVNASGSLSLTGLEQVEPFSVEALLRTQARFGPSSANTRLDLSLELIRGLQGRDYLTGARLEVQGGEFWQFARWRFFVRGGVVDNAIGTQFLALNPRIAALCGLGCRYEVPLGYWGPTLDVGARYALADRLALGTHAALELRKYLGESFVSNPGGGSMLTRELTAKTRRDLRVRPSLSVEYTIDARRRFALLAEYIVLLSASNIAFDINDPEHVFDYDNRNFAQHVLQLSLATQL